MTNFSMSRYTSLRTVPALVGILFVLASSVQFLDATLTFGIIDYTFGNQHALIVSLLALVVAFAASKTRSFSAYSREEKLIVAVAVVVIVGNEYVTQISDFMVNNDPVAGGAAFFVVFAAWGILSR